MNKIIFIVSIVTIISGLVGFFIPSPLTNFLRVIFLLAADMLIILLVGKLLFAGNRAVNKKRNNRTNSSIRTS